MVSLGATASPRAVRTAGWSADHVAIPAVAAPRRPESSMKFRRFSSWLMRCSWNRPFLEIRVERNVTRSHFGSNSALQGKQVIGVPISLVWQAWCLAVRGPNHNMETNPWGTRM